MKVHPRMFVVNGAKANLGLFLINLARVEALTQLEVATILGEEQANWLKGALREERHPDDPSKGADEA